MADGSFPTPAERPDGDVVVFDGECQFCRQQVNRLHQWDSANRLAFLSLHDPAVQRFCPNLTHEQLMGQMYVIAPDGQQYGGAAALRYLSRRIPRLWPVAPFLHIPFSMPVWQWLYRQVAVRRYRWNKTACDNGTCHIHFH